MATNESALESWTYVLDPDGDTSLVVHNVPKDLYLPLDLANLKLEPEVPAILWKPATFRPPSETKESTESKEGYQQPLRIRASSRHLSLASPYFARMLQGGFREGSALRSTGQVEIDIKDSCGISFLLLVMIIHGRTRGVPRVVSLQTLTDMAILVDYYECYEVVEVFSDMWIESLRKSVPKSIKNDDSDALKWLFISWVFDEKAIFSEITQLLQLESKDVICSGGLPIPATILEALNEGRSTCIEAIISALHLLFFQLSNGITQCHRDKAELGTRCTYAALGALTQRMTQMKLLFPKPQRPLQGYGFNQLLDDCRSQMKSPTFHEEKSLFSSGSSCDLANRVSQSLLFITRPGKLDIDKFRSVKAGPTEV